MAGCCLPFLQCCGCGLKEESLRETLNEKAFSPILNLDDLVAEFAYRKLAKRYKVLKGICDRPYPSQYEMDIKVLWDHITFTHNAPVEWTEKIKAEAAATDTSNGNNPEVKVTGTNDIELQVKATPNSLNLKGGFDPTSRMKNLSKETFTVKYDNTTDQPCSTTLNTERTIRSTFEVEVSKSIQTGHTLQLSLEVPLPCELEAEYEFTKMLESYKGERMSEEIETRMANDCPVIIEPMTSAEAIVTTTYQTYKQTLTIRSQFSGTVNVVAIERKRERSRTRVYDNFAMSAGDLFDEMLNSEQGKLLGQYISVNGDIVNYTSVATFSSNLGVDRHVKIIKRPLAPDQASPYRSMSAHRLETDTD